MTAHWRAICILPFRLRWFARLCGFAWFGWRTTGGRAAGEIFLGGGCLYLRVGGRNLVVLQFLLPGWNFFWCCFGWIFSPLTFVVFVIEDGKAERVGRV